MQRARATGAVAGFPEPVLREDLREVDYGDYEGLTSAQIHTTNPGWRLYRDGSPNGETPDQIYQRAQRFLDQAVAGAGADDNVLAFSHGHFIRALAVAFLELGIIHAGQLGLDTASITVLQEGPGGRLLQVWNSTV